ncbi:MAG: tRNA guanosine(34) transglycosylase Tgt [Candidatus Gastranaerophilaceae bacterium]|nr:tRNA guanosine(34) transglycosylase Tgt [Candidatus Gastranaerophilaceae bacterium]
MDNGQTFKNYIKRDKAHDYFNYELVHTCKQTGARAGVFDTPHGTILTPIFMPVGTNSAVKALVSDQITDTGAQIILANSYHLYLRAGTKLIKQFGGIHEWMNWHKPVLTDSGGFQVFSLSHLRKITEDGVEFRDPKDGKKHFISPETSMEIQQDIGADIIMAFDECAPYPCDYETAKAAMERTHRWLDRCFEAKTNPRQALFPIVQGAFFDDLRKESAGVISTYDTVGYAIGGVSVGEPADIKNHFVEFTAPLLPPAKPRYLMGVGTPEDLLDGIKNGIDMFDCVLPTRNARHGSFFTWDGKKNIKNKAFWDDDKPLVEGCNCYACRNHSRAYIRHLFRCQEATAATLLSIHNIQFLVEFSQKCRQAILEDRFGDFYSEHYNRLIKE